MMEEYDDHSELLPLEKHMMLDTETVLAAIVIVAFIAWIAWLLHV